MARSGILHSKANAKGLIRARLHCHPALIKPTTMLEVRNRDQEGSFYRLEIFLSFKYVGNPINQSNTIDALIHIFNTTKQIMHR